MILSSLFFSLSLIRRFLLFFKSFARSHSCLFLSFSPFPLRVPFSLFPPLFPLEATSVLVSPSSFFSLAAISTLFVSLSLSLRTRSASPSRLVPPRRLLGFLRIYRHPTPGVEGKDGTLRK